MEELKSTQGLYERLKKVGLRNELFYVESERKVSFDRSFFDSGSAQAGDILLTNADGTKKFFTTVKGYKELRDSGKIGGGYKLHSHRCLCYTFRTNSQR